MNTISIDQLEASRFYWARRKPNTTATTAEPGDIEVVKVSTMFGAASEFWTVAVVGSDEHFDLAAFEFLHKVPSPPQAAQHRPNLTVISASSHQVGG
ncbi:hypothetical protein [Rhizobium tubonense]|uniref:Uncharacterized protein n=1 Tax=Rhizobium tubonense TaxID=484088 RepID=A0A2W4CPJ2_9HYPH|nr:hypothetical protein [Rhizobium tubonense]PZM14321.1 hypothetical protein CPY51_11020 [Rhizobium tubonense]